MSAKSDAVNQAVSTLTAAIAIFDAGAVDPSPAAGPQAAAAAPLVSSASSQFGAALEVEDPETPAIVQMQLSLLRNFLSSEVGKIVAVAFIPWPFVYGGLGPISNDLNGYLAMAHMVQNMLKILPPFLKKEGGESEQRHENISSKQFDELPTFVRKAISDQQAKRSATKK